jgi:hypothetical protein
LHKTEGMRLREVKASETRNRALATARRIEIELRRIDPFDNSLHATACEALQRRHVDTDF